MPGADCAGPCRPMMRRAADPAITNTRVQDDCISTIQSWQEDPASSANPTACLVAGFIYLNEGNHVEALKACHGANSSLEMCASPTSCLRTREPSGMPRGPCCTSLAQATRATRGAIAHSDRRVTASRAVQAGAQRADLPGNGPRRPSREDRPGEPAPYASRQPTCSCQVH